MEPAPVVGGPHRDPDRHHTRRALVERLTAAGCVAAPEEATVLLAAAEDAPERLEALVARRVRGEPLAWITGHAPFGDFTVGVAPGVYVPRWQSLELARRAAERLPARGSAIDVCTGSGALASALCRARPEAHIVATDSDARAVACARANGIETHLGSLFTPLLAVWRRHADVVVAVVPYVPTAELRLLPPDTERHEDLAHYDGGPDGLVLLREVIAHAPRYLRPGGTLLLEVGGSQDELLRGQLARLGYVDVESWTDEDGDLRGLQASRP